MADEPNVTVKDVDGYPNWKLVSDGTNRRYVSPGGKNISRARFDKLRKRAEKEQRAILETEINASLDSPLPGIDNLFQPIKVSRPEDHPDLSAQQLKNQPPPVEEEEREQVQQIIDSLPEPELGGRASKKKPITAKEFADKLALGMHVGTGILGTLTTIPELQVPGQKAMSMSISIAWLMDKHDMLNSPIARAVANNEEVMVWARLGNDLYDYLRVAAPAVAAKVELMRASAEEKRARASQMNQQQPSSNVPRQHQEQPQQQQPATPQSQGATWEQQQAQKQAQQMNGQTNIGLRAGGIATPIVNPQQWQQQQGGQQ